jgi:hypothetical protein
MEAFLGAPVAVFIGLTLIIAGGARSRPAGSVGDNWKPAPLVVLAALGVALADRF